MSERRDAPSPGDWYRDRGGSATKRQQEGSKPFTDDPGINNDPLPWRD